MTVTVAPVIPGDEFPAGTQTQWVYTFTDAPCPTTTTTTPPPSTGVVVVSNQLPTAPPVPTSGQALAATGAENPLAVAVLALLVLLLGTGGLVVARRR